MEKKVEETTREWLRNVSHQMQSLSIVLVQEKCAMAI